MLIVTKEEIASLSSKLEELWVDSLSPINKEGNIYLAMEFKTEYLNGIPTFNGNRTELRIAIYLCL